MRDHHRAARAGKVLLLATLALLPWQAGKTIVSSPRCRTYTDGKMMSIDCASAPALRSLSFIHLGRRIVDGPEKESDASHRVFIYGALGVGAYRRPNLAG